MKILPPEPRPPEAPILRRHRPRPAGRWSAYRSCLRWDFGFTCPFCLLHESDLYGGLPGEGLAGTTVEHVVPRSADASRENDYDNCLYACRLCNRSRSAIPIRQEETRLLDPTGDAWGRHFMVEADQILPREGDADARATHRAYQLNDPRKVMRRRLRRELVSDRLRLLARLGAELVDLLRLAVPLLSKDRARFSRVLSEIQTLREDFFRAMGDLRRYEPVPLDAPQTCRCESADARSLPRYLDAQLIDVPSAAR